MSRKSSTTSSAPSSPATAESTEWTCEPTNLEPGPRESAPSVDSATALFEFKNLLDNVGMFNQPDLFGLILGKVIKSFDRRSDLDLKTAICILGDVGMAFHIWRGELEHDECCPLCNMTR